MYQHSLTSFIQLRATEAQQDIEVNANRLKITYPQGGAGSSFVFYVSPSLRQPNVKGWNDIQGVSVSISGNVAKEPDLKFYGRYGGSGSPWYDHNYWRFEHKMPAGFTGKPEIIIEFDSEK